MSRSITIQNIDQATATWLREEATRRGISEADLVLELLHTIIGADREHLPLQTYHELDSLAGSWSDEEATEFLSAISDFDRVEPTLWQ